MKKLFPASFRIVSSLFAKTQRQKAYRWMAVVFLAGCTNTQVRWDATRMRKDVMVYYNDQIMDNLIKAKNELPFVHVDIQTLTSTGMSQISGNIGYGETITNTGMQQGTNQTVKTETNSATPSHMLAGTIGIMGTLAHAAMRPFTYSVTPQQTESLSIIAAPALGAQAVASPTAIPEPPEWKPTKRTTTADLEEPEKPTSIKTEEVWKSSTPSPITIYELYDHFAKDPCKGDPCKGDPCKGDPCKGDPCKCGHLSHCPTEPQKGTYVPGTLKKGPTPKGRTEYYFIAKKDQEAYYEFCKALFTKGQAGSLETKLEVIQAAAAH